LTPGVGDATVLRAKPAVAAIPRGRVIGCAGSEPSILERFVRRPSLVIAAALATSCIPPALAQGGDPNAGRNLAATCQSCHRADGGQGSAIGSLAGKPRDEIVRKMQEFKSGARPATLMNQLAKGYTDEQIQVLAEWFAAQKPAN
jgi:cytochrome subunit of sulfide dehydrogenase